MTSQTSWAGWSCDRCGRGDLSSATWVGGLKVCGICMLELGRPAVEQVAGGIVAIKLWHVRVLSPGELLSTAPTTPPPGEMLDD